MKKKDKKPYGKTIGMEPYEQGFAIMYGDRELFCDYVKKNTEHDCIPDTFRGVTYTGTEGVFVYAGETIKDIPTLSHELLHVIFYAFGFIGYTLDMDDGGSHEPLTYMMSYLMKECLDKKGWSTYNKKSNSWK